MKTIIHVNQHVIKANRKHNECNPVLTCKTYKGNRYAHQVDILSDKGEVVASVIYSPVKPLSCGAHVWIETQNKILIDSTVTEYEQALTILKGE